MKGNNTKRSVAQIAVDAILEQLDKGVSPWHKPWECGAPRSYDGRIYRGINRFLLGLAPFDNPVFVTFKRAHELGGTIRKGEKAMPCFFWHVPKKPVNAEDGEDEGADEQDKNRHFFLRYYQVWNIAQTEGIPADKIAKVTPKRYEHQPIAEAEAIWDGFADKPALVANGQRAFYVPSQDSITVPPMSAFADREEYYSTLFHEAGHSTGHESRLNRKASDLFGSDSYGREELVAELCAAILCGECGIKRPLANSASYCENWAKAIRKAPANAVVSAASAAEKAADYILGRAEAKKEVA